MSKRQRRDHRAVPGDTRQGITLCSVCGDRVRLVRGYGVDDYWRHWRRDSDLSTVSIPVALAPGQFDRDDPDRP